MQCLCFFRDVSCHICLLPLNVLHFPISLHACDFCCFCWKLVIYRNSHLFHSLQTAFVLRKSLLISWVLVLSLRRNLGRNLKSLLRPFLSTHPTRAYVWLFQSPCIHAAFKCLNYPLKISLGPLMVYCLSLPWKGKKFYFSQHCSQYLTSGHHIYGQFSVVSNSDTNSLKLVYALQRKGAAPQDWPHFRCQSQFQLDTGASDWLRSPSVLHIQYFARTASILSSSLWAPHPLSMHTC